jgi:hypothetical protein
MLVRLLFILALLDLNATAQAQDLEPRRWNHVPVGVSFAGAGVALTKGEIFLDPVLRVEDLELRFKTGIVSVVHSFGLFGKSARIDLLVPIGSGHWSGLVDGEPRTLDLRGLMDPRVRFSINLYGAPALKMKEFAQYRANHPTRTIVGAGLTVTAPLGEYTSERLLNLGGNRWVFRPQLGVLHERGKMSYELTGSVFLFSANNDFFQDTVVKRDPLYYLQAHIVRTFRPGFWLGLGSGYAIAGRSSINQSPANDTHRDFWVGLSLGVPITPRQGLKLAVFRAKTNTQTGSTSSTAAISWSYMWGN